MTFTSDPGDPVHPESRVTAAPSVHGSVEIEMTLSGSGPYSESGFVQCQASFVRVIFVRGLHSSQLQREVRRRAVRSRLGWRRRIARAAAPSRSRGLTRSSVVDDGPVVAEAAVDPVAGAVTGKDAIVSGPTRHDVLPVTAVEDVVAAHSSQPVVARVARASDRPGPCRRGCRPSSSLR